MNFSDVTVIITNQIRNSSTSFRKDNLYCFEPLYKILKYNMQEYYNIQDDKIFNQFSDISDEYKKETDRFKEFVNSEAGKNLPVLLILQDCFDIPKKITDSILNEYKSSGDIAVTDIKNNKIFAAVISPENIETALKTDKLDFKNFSVDYAPAQNLKELRERNIRAQEEIIGCLEENGVQFVSLDGIGISPLAKIGRGTVIYHGTIIRGNSIIGENAVLGPDTIIDNSAVGGSSVINSTQVYSSIIENGVKIGPFCHIRPNCVIKSGAKIGDFVEIKNSNIGENTHASHLTYIGDSDVGKDVNFGCGCVTVNYDGVKKARCTIGDRAFIGCNTNLVAPVNIGGDAYTAAGSTLTKDVPAGALAVSRSREQKIVEGWVETHRNRNKK